MQGTILNVSFQDNVGMISGDDGNRYNFDAGQWRTGTAPAAGQRVDFIPSGTTATEVYPMVAQVAASTSGEKSKIVAGLLAFFLGSLGIHKFYLGYNTAGAVMLTLYLTGFLFAFLFIGFLWLWVPMLIAFIESIIYFTKSDYDFEQTYVVGDRPWF
ncbi:MAG: TM2 domain-containing protein [Coriobacteriia bacterium]|nr:TM2 domain-containing protein [Coriobacteriia bacterium]MCL2870997.1 TM2 domain-containing protein [Coriobacteriia bacterium]